MSKMDALERPGAVSQEGSRNVRSYKRGRDSLGTLAVVSPNTGHMPGDWVVDSFVEKSRAEMRGFTRRATRAFAQKRWDESVRHYTLAIDLGRAVTVTLEQEQEKKQVQVDIAEKAVMTSVAIQRHKVAVEHLRQGALEIDEIFSQLATLLFRRAAVHVQKGGYHDLHVALQDIDDVIALGPSHSRYFFLKGIALERLGQDAKASEALVIATRLAPSDVDIRKHFDACLARLRVNWSCQYAPSWRGRIGSNSAAHRVDDGWAPLEERVGQDGCTPPVKTQSPPPAKNAIKTTLKKPVLSMRGGQQRGGKPTVPGATGGGKTAAARQPPSSAAKDDAQAPLPNPALRGERPSPLSTLQPFFASWAEVDEVVERAMDSAHEASVDLDSLIEAEDVFWRAWHHPSPPSMPLVKGQVLDLILEFKDLLVQIFVMYCQRAAPRGEEEEQEEEEEREEEGGGQKEEDKEEKQDDEDAEENEGVEDDKVDDEEDEDEEEEKDEEGEEVEEEKEGEKELRLKTGAREGGEEQEQDQEGDKAPPQQQQYQNHHQHQQKQKQQGPLYGKTAGEGAENYDSKPKLDFDTLLKERLERQERNKAARTMRRRQQPAIVSAQGHPYRFEHLGEQLSMRGPRLLQLLWDCGLVSGTFQWTDVLLGLEGRCSRKRFNFSSEAGPAPPGGQQAEEDDLSVSTTSSSSSRCSNRGKGSNSHAEEESGRESSDDVHASASKYHAFCQSVLHDIFLGTATTAGAGGGAGEASSVWGKKMTVVTPAVLRHTLEQQQQHKQQQQHQQQRSNKGQGKAPESDMDMMVSRGAADLEAGQMAGAGKALAFSEFVELLLRLCLARYHPKVPRELIGFWDTERQKQATSGGDAGDTSPQATPSTPARLSKAIRPNSTPHKRKQHQLREGRLREGGEEGARDGSGTADLAARFALIESASKAVAAPKQIKVASIADRLRHAFERHLLKLALEVPEQGRQGMELRERENRAILETLRPHRTPLYRVFEYFARHEWWKLMDDDDKNDQHAKRGKKKEEKEEEEQEGKREEKGSSPLPLSIARNASGDKTMCARQFIVMLLVLRVVERDFPPSASPNSPNSRGGSGGDRPGQSNFGLYDACSILWASTSRTGLLPDHAEQGLDFDAFRRALFHIGDALTVDGLSPRDRRLHNFLVNVVYKNFKELLRVSQAHELPATV